MVDELQDGPLDGFRFITTGRIASYMPPPDVVRDWKIRQPVLYIRREDGRLYWDRSNWIVPNKE